jgi:phosphatidylinositol alpha-1,6-mannosyltransferase
MKGEGHRIPERLSPATPEKRAVPAAPNGSTRAVILASEFPPGPGGIGRHAHQLAVGLHRMGWDIIVATSQDYAADEEVRAFNQSQLFPVVRFRRILGSPFEALYRGFVLGKCVRAHAPSILIASGSRAVMLAAARWSAKELPWVAIGHGTEFGARSGWQATAVRCAFDKATAVVCVSEYTRNQMHAAGVRPRSQYVIPNGADPERFCVLPDEDSISIRRELGLPDGHLLVTLGNVTERKGQDIVVRALPAILMRVPDVHYAIAGLPTLGKQNSNAGEGTRRGRSRSPARSTRRCSCRQASERRRSFRNDQPAYCHR